MSDGPPAYREERCYCGANVIASGPGRLVDCTVECAVCGWRLTMKEYRVYRGYVPKDFYTK
jgi:hypothetical protein